MMMNHGPIVMDDQAGDVLRRFPDRETRRDRQYQDRKLRACGVDPERYGNIAETGLFGQDCFKMMTAAGETLDGMVHMAQRFILHRPPILDEPLRQRGWIARDEPHPRGRRIVQVFVFDDGDGARTVTAEMYRLVPDPERMGSRRNPGDAVADPCEGFECVARKCMRPDDVTGFSEDVGNLIHFQPEFAARYGYRAPIAQGIQTMVWMMSALAERSIPVAFDVTARFLRPLYWDEALALWGRSDCFRAIAADGRLLAELNVASVTW